MAIVAGSIDIKPKGGTSLGYVVHYRDTTGPHEVEVSWEIGRLLWGAIAQGRAEIRDRIKRDLEI
jgi:hypothetical protein